jgi:nucleoside-diphosphate-sugar epimerase
MKRVLVTGAAGYIGSALVRLLLDQGHTVTAVDSLVFGGESLMAMLPHPRFRFIKADVRDTKSLRTAVVGHDAVAHLAAIVGDPACRLEPELAREVNVEATKRLYELSDELGIDRFVFASTCSNYGKMSDPNTFVCEESELRPVSVYAETKVAVEKFLLGQSTDRHCIPTCLRFSTVFGLSPRARFDLTVNDFTKEVVMGRELVVFGEQFWRPYCHVEDLARAVSLVISAPENKIAFEVFNVGDDEQNFQKRTIVDLILKEVPQARVRFVPQGDDPRDYRVTFRKIREKLGFRITKTVPDGIREIRDLLAAGFIMNPDDPKYYNVSPAPVAKAA